MDDGKIKLLIVGAGAILAFSQFGPVGVVLLGILLVALNK